MGMAGSIFELHLPKFQNQYNSLSSTDFKILDHPVEGVLWISAVYTWNKLNMMSVAGWIFDGHQPHTAS